VEQKTAQGTPDGPPPRPSSARGTSQEGLFETQRPAGARSKKRFVALFDEKAKPRKGGGARGLTQGQALRGRRASRCRGLPPPLLLLATHYSLRPSGAGAVSKRGHPKNLAACLSRRQSRRCTSAGLGRRGAPSSRFGNLRYERPDLAAA
jgi:hypothetical protein